MPRSEAGDDCDTVTRSVTHMARHPSRPCRDAQQQTGGKQSLPSWWCSVPQRKREGALRKLRTENVSWSESQRPWGRAPTSI